MSNQRIATLVAVGDFSADAPLPMLQTNELFVGGLARWSVRGAHGVVALTAMWPQPCQRNPVRDKRGLAWQPEAITVHRAVPPTLTSRPEPECDVLPQCWGGPMFTAFAWQVLRRWERHGHPDGQIAADLGRIYVGVFGSGV